MENRVRYEDSEIAPCSYCHQPSAPTFSTPPRKSAKTHWCCSHKPEPPGWKLGASAIGPPLGESTCHPHATHMPATVHFLWAFSSLCFREIDILPILLSPPDFHYCSAYKRSPLFHCGPLSFLSPYARDVFHIGWMVAKCIATALYLTTTSFPFEFKPSPDLSWLWAQIQSYIRYIHLPIQSLRCLLCPPFRQCLIV